MHYLRILFLFAASLGFGATGEVVLLGSSQIGTAGSYQNLGNTFAKAFDDDFTTFFDSPTGSAGDWLGISAGTSVVLTRYRVAPRLADQNYYYENRLAGLQIGRASSCSTHSYSGFTAVDIIPTDASNWPWPMLQPRQFNERASSVWTGQTGTTAPCWIAYWSTAPNRTNIAELQFLVRAGSGGFNARPDAPTIRPWGGIYPWSPTVRVSLSTLTTSATLYCTTDGSTPTNSSTNCTNGITVTPSSGVILKAIAYDASLSTPASSVAAAIFTNNTQQPQANVYDVDTGNLIQAHAGGITWIDGLWYWVGTNTNSGNNPNFPYGGTGTWFEQGVWMYHSSDLYNWHFDGEIINNVFGSTAATQIERPHIEWNPNTSKYVMWAHTPLSSSYSVAGNATASSIAGPWTWVKLGFDPDGHGSQDEMLWKDPDTNKAYFVHTPSNQQGIYLDRLTSDYLSRDTSASPVLLWSGQGREGVAMLKRHNADSTSTYFIISSNLCPYGCTDPSHTGYYEDTNLQYSACNCSDPMTGTWTAPANLFSTSTQGTAYSSQSSGVIVLPFKKDGFVLMGDHWVAGTTSQSSGNYAARQVWYPLVFTSNTTVQAQTVNWDPDRDFQNTFKLE